MAKRTWRQINGKMVEVTPAPNMPEELRVDSPFISPIDGSVISNKRELHEHNKRNNVEQTTDGHFDDFKAFQKRRDDFYLGKTGKEERIEAIKESLYKLGERP